VCVSVCVFMVRVKGKVYVMITLKKVRLHSHGFCNDASHKTFTPTYAPFLYAILPFKAIQKCIFSSFLFCVTIRVTIRV